MCGIKDEKILKQKKSTEVLKILCSIKKHERLPNKYIITLKNKSRIYIEKYR